MKKTIIAYYTNGNKMCETPCLNNYRFNGLQIVWYNNGNRWEETPFKNHIQHGSKTLFNY